MITEFDFKIGKLLGEGKFGKVFLAFHIKTGFVCAIKKINIQTIIDAKMEN